MLDCTGDWVIICDFLEMCDELLLVDYGDQCVFVVDVLLL